MTDKYKIGNILENTYIESFDVNKAKQLLKLAKANKEDWAVSILDKIIKKNKDGIINTKYKRKLSFGRVYPKKLVSLSQITKQYRQALLCEEYYDFDLVNAQPTCLFEYCKMYGRQMTELEKYVKDRENYLNEIISNYDVTREQAKELIIAVINSGSILTWKERSNCNDKMDIPSIHNLKKEINNSINFIISENIELYNEVVKKCNDEDKTNLKGSFMSYFNGELEFRVLEQAINYTKLVFDNTNELILAHDGYNIRQSLFKNSNIDKNQFCVDLSIYLNQCFSSNYFKIINKSMDQAITIPQNIDNDNDNDNIDNDNDYKLIMNYLNNFSHLSYAKDFYNIFKDEFIYYEKSWYCINNNNVWIKQSEEPINVKKKITIFTEKRLETYDGIIKTKNLDNNSDIVNSYSKYKKETGSSFFETGVINFLKQNYFNDTENLFDSNPYLFSLNNKVLDLKNKIFRDIKANDFISITTGYDFEEQDDTKIEELNKILKQIYPNQDELIYTLNRVSRCFYGKSPEKIYFEVGDGGNGKSLFYSSFLKEVFGNYYCTATKSLLTSPIKIGACPELMALRNKRLIVISETDQGDIFNIGVINTISGGEDITTRPLFDKTISFEILGTVFILTNFKPKFNGPVQSNLIRRMFVVPYNSRFTEDDDLVDESCYIYKANPDIKLKDNLIQYRCQLLHLLNLNYNNKFTTPKTILNFTNEYFKNCSSSFIEWFAEKYSQIYSGPINDTKRKELVEKKYYLSISDIFESYKNSDNYRNLDKNDRRNNTLTYVKDCLIKSLYTKYFVERFQYVIGEKKENKRNILVGFVSIESNDLYIDSEHGLPEKDI